MIRRMYFTVDLSGLPLLKRKRAGAIIVSHAERGPVSKPEKYTGAFQMKAVREFVESKSPTANSVMNDAFTGEILNVQKIRKPENTKREEGRAAYLKILPNAIGSRMFSNPVNDPQTAQPRKYAAIAKSAAKKAAWIAPLFLFWYAAMLNVLGPFASAHSSLWGSFLQLEDFWMQGLNLPYPRFAPSYPFDFLVLDSLLGSALIRGGNIVQFLCINLIAFEAGVFTILPVEIFNHATYFTAWKIEGFYIVNNFLVMVLAQVGLSITIWNRR